MSHDALLILKIVVITLVLVLAFVLMGSRKSPGGRASGGKGEGNPGDMLLPGMGASEGHVHHQNCGHHDVGGHHGGHGGDFGGGFDGGHAGGGH